MLHFRCLTGFLISIWTTHRYLKDRANVYYCENQSVFIVLPIIQNQSKTKTIPHTVFEKFIKNNSQYITQNISWCVLWVGDARNIHRSSFIKNHYWNLKLCVVALSSVIKNSPEKWKKSQQKDVSDLKNEKKISHSMRYKKDIKKEKRWETKSVRKV